MFKTPQETTVVVGMSGGVDSSVSALLLKEQGYKVIGLFMKNWDEKEAENCSATKDYEDVMRVCDTIGIPCFTINFVKEYWDNVFEHFINELKEGLTPNPDILCNREIKFKYFLEKAKEIGADYLATGHYAQIKSDGGSFSLVKGLDPNKDQTYFLYTLKEDILKKVMFPVGHLHKSEVREIARKHNLATSDKKDSTGICFIGKRNFKEFISSYIAYKPGPFQTLEGKKVGMHSGAAYYTIGQRKGLGIGGPGEAWFVVDKNIHTNSVYVMQGEMHPALYADTLTANEVTWVGKEPSFPLRCKAKIRYRQVESPCTVDKMEDGAIKVSFDSPQRAITPRQSIVFYQDDTCLGGAMIICRGKSYYELKKDAPKHLSVEE